MLWDQLKCTDCDLLPVSASMLLVSLRQVKALKLLRPETPSLGTECAETAQTEENFILGTRNLECKFLMNVKSELN